MTKWIMTVAWHYQPNDWFPLIGVERSPWTNALYVHHNLPDKCNVLLWLFGTTYWCFWAFPNERPPAVWNMDICCLYTWCTIAQNSNNRLTVLSSVSAVCLRLHLWAYSPWGQLKTNWKHNTDMISYYKVVTDNMLENSWHLFRYHWGTQFLLS